MQIDKWIDKIPWMKEKGWRTSEWLAKWQGSGEKADTTATSSHPDLFSKPIMIGRGKWNAMGYYKKSKHKT